MREIQDFPRAVPLLIELIRNNESITDNLASIYLFSMKKISQLLFLYQPESDLESLKLQVYKVTNQVQDQLFFPENIIEPLILCHTNNWKEINPFNDQSLTKTEYLQLIRERHLVYGSDIIQENEFSEPILSFETVLDANKLNKLVKYFPNYLPLINPFICWQRFKFVIPRGKLSMILFKKLSQFKKVQKRHRIVLYGRYWGSGKTSLLYWIMKICKDLNVPFMYRSEFWKDETGKYKSNDEGKNEAAVVTQWIIENKPSSSPFVLLLDEVDFEDCPDFFNVFVVVASKEIPEFSRNENYEIFDLMNKYPFSNQEVTNIILNLTNDVILKVFDEKLILKIAQKHHKWRFPKDIKDPVVAIRISSYSLGMALSRRYLNANVSIKVTENDIDYWLSFADSPYIKHYPEVHDVHAEYLIFNGMIYLQVDPYNPGPLP